MDVLWGDSVEVEIDAPPEHVWGLVADVRRMGEWSPVCRTCDWIGESKGPAVGARFVGRSQMRGLRWSRECEVTECEPGRAFAFRTFFRGAEATRWRYRFEPSGSGTKVTESYEAVTVPRWLRLPTRVPAMVKRSRRDALRGMRSTLERIKAAAESGNR